MAQPTALPSSPARAGAPFSLFSGPPPRQRPSRTGTGMLAPSNPLGRRDTQERGRYSHISTDAFSDDLYHHHRHAPRWAVLYAAPVGVYKASVTRFGRRRGPAMLVACVLVLVLTALAFHGRFVSAKRSWPLLGATSTVVFEREQLRKIWEWEILSGHYPSTRASECFGPTVTASCAAVLTQRVALPLVPSVSPGCDWVHVSTEQSCTTVERGPEIPHSFRWWRRHLHRRDRRREDIPRGQEPTTRVWSSSATDTRQCGRLGYHSRELRL